MALDKSVRLYTINTPRRVAIILRIVAEDTLEIANRSSSANGRTGAVSDVAVVPGARPFHADGASGEAIPSLRRIISISPSVAASRAFSNAPVRPEVPTPAAPSTAAAFWSGMELAPLFLFKVPRKADGESLT
jgi:hypothetical protein